MRICKITDLKGGEILAKPIITSDYQILLSENTKLKKEYIEKLMDLGIREVFILEEIHTQEAVILKSEIEELCKFKVKALIEKHTYNNRKELMELSKTADYIICNLLNEKEVMEKVYDIRNKSTDIYEHSISVCLFSIIIALKMKLTEDVIHDMGIGCLLHDLGFRYITVNFYNRNLEELTEYELSEYKKHPVYGYSALAKETWISELSKNIILSHHENRKGSGYPLKKKDISTEVKIVSICEAFDEMICGIGCRQKKVHEAIEYLNKKKNVLFDGKIVDIFLQLAAMYPAGSYVMTNEGEVGIVLRQNNKYPDKPFIKVIYDKKGELVQQDIVKDLSLETNIYIIKEVENLN